MENLAGLPTNYANRVVSTELNDAGIPLVNIPEAEDEVMATIIGKLILKGEVTATFRRMWYYWSVQLSQPLPYGPASRLNGKLGGDVRVNGFSGGTDVPQDGCSHYNVDTAPGLKELVETLRAHFGV